MYSRFPQRVYRAFVRSSRSRGDQHVPTSCRRPLEVTFNRPSVDNLTRTLHSSNILHWRAGTATLCENRMELVIKYEQLLEAQNDPNVLIVDVREPSEIANTGALPGSINIRMDDARNELVNLTEEEFQEKYGKPKPTKNTKIIFSCQSGRRAGIVQQKMQESGYTQAYNYKGSWTEWEQKQKEKMET